MSSTLGVVIMMNNYFHDVATALLAASGAAMWMMTRSFEQVRGKDAERLFLVLYRSMTRLAAISLVWILLGGIPRVIFYERFEWAEYAGKGQVTAIAVKHVFMFALVGLGAAMWSRLRAKARSLAAETNEPG